MIILKSLLILALTLPANANNIDDEIIKNLYFFQSMDLMKDENQFAYKQINKANTSDDQSSIQKETFQKSDNENAEKKQ
ncbi:MAG: hypothetical protein PHY93_12870 [Bacteriovorax sp.]|nr:hypothetical protein [Bacteriovorax sp.]